MIKESLMELIELLIEVNHCTRHTVMFDYLGHTEGFSIRFYESGWEEKKVLTENHRFYLDDENWEEEVDKLYRHYFEILNKDHICGYDEECGF